MSSGSFDYTVGVTGNSLGVSRGITSSFIALCVSLSHRKEGKTLQTIKSPLHRNSLKKFEINIKKVEKDVGIIWTT